QVGKRIGLRSRDQFPLLPTPKLALGEAELPADVRPRVDLGRGHGHILTRRPPEPMALHRKVLEVGSEPEDHGYVATPRPQPVELHEHAMDNLRYIRRTIERAGSFTAVPGIGGMLMGSTALLAAWLADRQSITGRWLAVWLGEALVALLIGLGAAALKAR